MKNEKNHESHDNKKHKKSSIGSKKNIYYAAGACVLIVLILLAVFISGNLRNKTLAIVNGEEVKQSDFNMLKKRLNADQQGIITDDVLLNQTIAEFLLIQAAKEHGINVLDFEVETLMADFKTQSGISDDKFKELLKEQDLTLKEAKELYKKQLYIAKEINMSILKTVNVTEKEIKSFYDSNKDLFNSGEQRKVAHILIKVDETRDDVAAKKLADDIKKEITSSNFADLAKKYSEDPGSKDKGGEYTFGKGVMVEEFESAAFVMDVNELRVVKTQFGYHILKLIEKLSSGTMSYQTVKAQIQQSLLTQKQQKALSDYVDSLISKADIKFIGATENSSKMAKKAPVGGISTFESTGDEACKEGSLPIVSVYSTSWCPHCQWISGTINKVLIEYAAAGKIVVHHFELDTGDDKLTMPVETIVPQVELDKYNKYNPQGSIPTFVFGCSYVRIGNGYEAQDDLVSEEAEFRAVLEELIK